MTKRNRGQALIYVGLCLLAFVSLAALVVDGARLYFSAREAQAAADAAAIGGMLRLIETGSASDAVAGAQQSANLNTVNGQAAAIDANNIFVGHWSCSPAGRCTPTFAPGLTPYNAVRTTPSYPISNLVGIWQAVAHPRRNATAAWLTIDTAIVGGPFLLGNCFSCYSAACNPPPQELVLATGGTASTNGAYFYPNCTSGCGKPEVEKYIPAGCGGGGLVAPALSRGSTVTVNGGSLTTLCHDFDCLVGKKYLVPVVGDSCGQPLVRTVTVSGFATAKILGTRCNGNPVGDAPTSNNAIKIQSEFIDCSKPENASICSSQLTSECPGCGTGFVVMVE